jgi:hypothetical protein
MASTTSRGSFIGAAGERGPGERDRRRALVLDVAGARRPAPRPPRCCPIWRGGGHDSAAEGSISTATTPDCCCGGPDEEGGGRHGAPWLRLGGGGVTTGRKDTRGIYVISPKSYFWHLNASNAYIEGRRE